MSLHAELIARLLQSHEEVISLAWCVRERMMYRSEYELDGPEEFEQDMKDTAMKMFSAARVCLDTQQQLGASVDTEQRAAFESGWEQGANFEHRSLIEDIELDIAEAYTRYQQSRRGERT